MNTQDNYDYVVVGGGSAGCIVAARLAEESNATVLLLEAGQNAQQNPEITTADGFKYTFSNEQTMWDRMTTVQSHAGQRPIYCGSGRGMGGSGSVNGMVYTRGDKHDYANWPKGWQWDDLLPYFEKVEQRLTIRQREGTPFTEACVKSTLAVGFERKNSLNDGHLCGYIGYNDMNYRGEQRRSSYMAFLHDQQASLPNLTIKTECKVHRIVFDDDKRAIAVECVEHGQHQSIAINREIILCAGALETPKLLLLSGIGPKNQLEALNIALVADEPQIGKNLHDHPSVCLFYQANRPIDFFFPQLYGFQRLNPNLNLPCDQADTCITFFSVTSVLEETLKKMLPRMLLPTRLEQITGLRHLVRKAVSLAFKLPVLNRFVDRLFGIIVILGKPVSRGELTLRSSNPDDQANINPAYFHHPDDVTTMMTGIEMAARIAQQNELQAWDSAPLSRDAVSDDTTKRQRWMEKTSMTTYHYCGTCAMGESDSNPVTPDLRLRASPNIRIADASVMPEVPVSATNAPSMMIGYRATEFLLAHTQVSTNRHPQKVSTNDTTL